MKKATTLQLAAGTNLPLATVTGTLAILGIRGSGKTNTAVVLAEELLDQGQQVVVIDPTDVWWGLKSSKDGNAAGYPVVILGGKHGDIPMNAEDGATVADFIVEERASVILSMRHFESRADARRFVTDVCNRMYHRKGETEYETPLHLIIDEASMFVPQKVTGELAHVVGAIQRLVRQGRASGFGVSLIDQRAATVNKDVLTQSEILVCHRTTSPQDRDALQAWIEAHDTAGHGKQFLQSLASLPRGTAWLWSPSWLDIFEKVAVRERKTFDSSRTPAPGEIIAKPKKLAEIDLTRLKGKLAESLERAKADDPTVLRARIKELEKAARSPHALAPSGPGGVHIEYVTPPQLLALASAYDAFRKSDPFALARDAIVGMTEISRLQALVMERVQRLDALMRDLDNLVAAEIQRDRKALGTPAVPLAPGSTLRRGVVQGRDTPSVIISGGPVERQSVRINGKEVAEIGRTPLKLLGALLFYDRFGNPTPSKAALAAFVGIRHTTGTFSTYISELKAAGLIDEVSRSDVALTALGRATASTSTERLPATLSELHAMWRGKLGGTPGKMLDILIRVHPRPIAKERIAATLGISHTTGTFSTYISQLREAGLLQEVTRSEVVATDFLFPKGLR